MARCPHCEYITDGVGYFPEPLWYGKNEGGEYIVCISELGKLFISEGMRAKDTYNLWNGLWGEYKCGFLKWIDYKAGKEFQRSQYKNKSYF